MHVGLIGGIGPAATDVYYRGLVARLAEAGADLEMTIAHADTSTLLANLAAGRAAEQCAIFGGLTDRLAVAGAEAVAITAISGHFCIDALAERSPLPILDMVDAVAAHLQAEQLLRVGILGTASVMETGMYGRLRTAEIIAPEGESLHAVHEAYVALARAGRATEEMRDTFVAAGAEMVERGAEAVLLGGTDLAVVFDGAADGPFPVVDCAQVHIDRIAAAAMS